MIKTVVFFGMKTWDSLVGTATRGVGSEKKTTAEAMVSGWVWDETEGVCPIFHVFEVE